MRRCTKCTGMRPLAEFSKDKSRRDGLHPWCKTCRSASRKRRYRTHKQEIDARNQAYVAANRERVNEYQRQWRKRNPEKVRETVARRKERHRELVYRWRDEHPELVKEISRNASRRRRARKNNASVHSFSREQLAARLSMFPGCWMCGGDATEVDHVKPLAKGGGHILANLRPICKTCNNHKRARWPIPTSSYRR